jgi:NADH:ubiquinone oxidoreductase subunit 3 (subunit A)
MFDKKRFSSKFTQRGEDRNQHSCMPDYNWEEIFKHKTNKELYAIYKGKTTLPESIGQLAKKELEKRGFDFNDLETNNAAWRLSQLMREDYEIAHNLNRNTTRQISPILFAILFSLFSLFVYFVFNIHQMNATYQVFVIILVFIFTAIYTLINNYFHSKNLIKRENRKKEIEQLKEFLEKRETLISKSYIYEDIKREEKIDKKMDRKISYTMIAMSILLLLVFIIKTIKGT